MCGIAGIFLEDRHGSVAPELLHAMEQEIVHRGPDGSGVRNGPGYGLAHRRLAIVDLAQGSQPMCDADENIWITFNGEIYNYLDLRTELEAVGYRFRTNCDTETLIYGYLHWGDRLPEKLRGMFAFVVVDETRHRMLAARDRLGKKPFHYASTDRGLVFGSEIKAMLVEGTGVGRGLDHEAIAEYLCLGYVPDPKTAFSGVKKLPPAHQLTIDENGKMEIRPYWRLSFAEVSPSSEEDLAQEILELLDEATRIRLMGDVPLGAFLSGGVDSQAVVESMSRSTAGAVIACTMGFDDPRWDERPYARDAAKACGAELHEEVVRVADMEDQAWFSDTFDEPFADSSAIPTYHVSRLARRHVTVALSGDGGDEAFAGYRRYGFEVFEHRVRRFAPRFLATCLGAVYPKADWLPRALRAKRTFQNLGYEPAEAYARSVSTSLPHEVLPLLRFDTAGFDPLAPVKNAYHAADGPDPLSRVLATDFATELPGGILAKVDRASMAVSLEVRAPLLDHKLVEAAARIPSALKLRDGQTKGFLRHALVGRLGQAVMKRPKQGFAVPLRDWFHGSLGQRLEEDLGSSPLADVMDAEAVNALLVAHRSGLKDHGQLLWSILCLGRFLRRWAG